MGSETDAWGAEWGDTRVREVMVGVPSTHSADLTVEQARRAFDNPKLHMVLLTDAGVLLGTLVRDDLAHAPDSAAETPALAVARIHGRTVSPDEPVAPVHAAMVHDGLRRLAVVEHGELVGLLCLKRRQHGFCSDEGIATRRRERWNEPLRGGVAQADTGLR